MPVNTYVPRWALVDNTNGTTVACVSSHTPKTRRLMVVGRFLGSANLTEDPTAVTTTTLIIATPTSIPLYDGPPTVREQAATSKATAAMAGASKLSLFLSNPVTDTK